MNLIVPFALAGGIIVAAGPTIERLAAKPVMPAIVKIPDRLTVVPKAVTWSSAEPVRYPELWRDGLLNVPVNVPVNVPIMVLKVKQDDVCISVKRRGARRPVRHCLARKLQSI
jgi:hypothetical protein